MGKYRLERRIGRGAFAEVWKARDSIENRWVALKLAHRETVAEWGREAIEHEARIATAAVLSSGMPTGSNLMT